MGYSGTGITHSSNDTFIFMYKQTAASPSYLCSFIGRDIISNYYFNRVAAAPVSKASSIYRVKEYRKIVLLIMSRDNEGEEGSSQAIIPVLS